MKSTSLFRPALRQPGWNFCAIRDQIIAATESKFLL